MDFLAKQKSASVKLKAVGMLAVLLVQNTGEYDAVAGKRAADTTEQHNVYVVKAEAGSTKGTSILESNVKSGDLLLLMEAGIVEPKAGNKLFCLEKTWTIEVSDYIGTAETPVVYVVHATL